MKLSNYLIGQWLLASLMVLGLFVTIISIVTLCLVVSWWILAPGLIGIGGVLALIIRIIKWNIEDYRKGW